MSQTPYALQESHAEGLHKAGDDYVAAAKDVALQYARLHRVHIASVALHALGTGVCQLDGETQEIVDRCALQLSNVADCLSSSIGAMRMRMQGTMEDMELMASMRLPVVQLPPQVVGNLPVTEQPLP